LKGDSMSKQPSLFEKFREPLNDLPTPTAELLGGRGILTPRDLDELRAGTRCVAELMLDEQWHGPDAICCAAGMKGTPAREGLRRLRELRKLPGVLIEKKRVSEGRQWVYRLSIR